MKDNCNLEWEEIFANEDTHKEFISKTYKEPHTAQYQKHNNPRHKRAKHRNGYFLEEDIQILIRHMNTCSASLILTQRQIKSSMRYHLTLVQMAISKHLQKDKSPSLVDRVFTTSTSWEALFQYKKTTKVQEKVKKKESGAKRKAAALWPYW